jgi:signal recognition particle receptor subunit beta
MTLKTVRIIVVGGDDTGKTAFIKSLGGAVSTEGSTTDEKSVTFKSGDDLITFVFVELPSEKFKKFFIERLTILPAEFNDGHGVALFFSHADHLSREPCDYWLKFLSTLDQGDGLKPTIVVVGNKADLMEAESPPAHFVSKFDCGELINVDSRMSDDHKLHLSPMRVLLRFADEMLRPRENIDCLLVPVASAPPVGILIPTEESQMLLKPVVLRVGQRIALGRQEIHTGYIATKIAMALLKSISRQHIEVVFQANGTTSITKLSECPVSILNANGRCIQTIRTKNKVGVVPVNGMINLNHGTDQVTYKVGSFESFVSGPAAESGPLSISNLLQEKNLIYKKHVKLLEAELARSSHQVKFLEKFLATNSGAAAARSTGLGEVEEELSQLSVNADDNSEASDESDIYFGNTQAY